ncbi:hypothetical protein BX600DRAFT_511780 [Xylariales sp. PMI_506]|nr:hypothetical protein BX600DRAFT_511780 [Xylariales sp. PMI_506]
MPLQFINLHEEPTRIGGEGRRLIRSHVMKGRNTGKSRRTLIGTPSKRILLRFDCLGCSDAKIARRVHSCACYKRILDMRQLIWNDLALVSVPYQLDRRLRGLIHECFLVASQTLYPPRFCLSDNSMMSTWIQFVFQDEAYLHCSLAVVFSYTDYFIGHAHVSPRALSHLTKAYALVNKNLSAIEATSMMTIAAVTTLAMFQSIHHLHTVGMIHFEGLRKIIRGRGGMAKLGRENAALAQKPWRLDIELALQGGSPVCFIGKDAPPCIFPASVLLKSGQASKISKSGLHQIFECQPDQTILGTIGIEIRSFSDFLNNIGEDNKLAQLDFAQHVQYLLHRLLEFTPLLAWKNLMGKDKILYPTLVALMTTLLHEYGRQQSQYDLLAQIMREELHEIVPLSIAEKEFVLWVTFVASISVLDSKDDEWLMAIVRIRCAELGLQTWEQVQAILYTFAWISPLHDNAGQMLYEAACRTNQPL